MKKIYLVDTISDGMRLDRFIHSKHPHLNFMIIQKLCRKGDIRLNTKKTKANIRVENGQEISIFDPSIDQPDQKKSSPLPKPNQYEIDELKKSILYQNNDFLILNKPSSLAVQGGSKTKKHIDLYLPYLSTNQKDDLKLVHRLDKDTSGVLVIAKNRKSAEYLTKAFKDHQVTKKYWALVHGVPEQENGFITYPLKKVRGSWGEKVVPDEDGQFAKSSFEIIDTIGKDYCWLELIPLTGRTHQLRVHTLLLNCSIVGDTKYGENHEKLEDLGIEKKLHLHAQSISIPMGKKEITITAPLPPHMKKSWKNLGLDDSL